MQIAVIEFARDVAGIKDATSGEFLSETSGEGHAVIDILPEKKGKKIGGTMRLGEYVCALKEGTKISEAYGGKKTIRERHRHRYEFNDEYRDTLQNAGLVVGGTSPVNRIVETVEVKNHPFFVGVQFHPEFTSTPETPNPLFCAFVGAAKTKAGE